MQYGLLNSRHLVDAMSTGWRATRKPLGSTGGLVQAATRFADTIQQLLLVV